MSLKLFKPISLGELIGYLFQVEKGFLEPIILDDLAKVAGMPALRAFCKWAGECPTFAEAELLEKLLGAGLPKMICKKMYPARNAPAEMLLPEIAAVLNSYQGFCYAQNHREKRQRGMEVMQDVVDHPEAYFNAEELARQAKKSTAQVHATLQGPDERTAEATGVIPTAKSLNAAVERQSIASEQRAHDNLREAIKVAANALELIAPSDPPRYYAPPAFRSLLGQPWTTALLTRQWDDDPAPSFPEEADLPDGAAVKKSLESLWNWSQRTLDRLVRQTNESSPTESTATLDPQRFRRGPDYRDCTWNGERYTFTTTQAACVQVLWEERDKGTVEIGQQLLLEKSGAESQQLKDVFKKHDAWGAMIVRGSKSGLYKLADPI